MADEQTIYLSSEEELTSVRERLERTQARRIILVIPHQTQLRSHVGWRLIYARMRELDKELLVISPDQQVRAVARAAGFKVAESQESSSNRPRLSSRTGNINTRGAGRSRIGGSRAGAESRGTKPQPPSQRRLPGSNASNRPLTRPSASAPGEESYADETSFGRGSGRGEDVSGSSQIAPATFFEAPQDQHPVSSKPFRISTTPSVRPSIPHMDDNGDEEALPYDYDKDYDTAQRIRDAARLGAPLPASDEQQSGLVEKKSQVPASGRWPGIDPYASFDDDHELAPLPEQRGSAPGSIDELDAENIDISDRSTEIMPNEIEDLGDQGVIDLPEINPKINPTRGQSTSIRPLREQGGGRAPSRGAPMPPRHSPRSPRPELDLDEDDDPLPIADKPAYGGPGIRQPSRNLSRQERRPSQPMVPGQSGRISQPIAPDKRPSQPMVPGQSGRISQPIAPDRRPSQPMVPGQSGRSPQPMASGQSKRPSQPISLKQVPGAATRRPSQGSSQRPPNRQLVPLSGSKPQQAAHRRGGRSLTAGLSAVVVLLVLAIVLFAFVPSATVTIFLQAKTFDQTVHLTATADPHATVPNKVLAQTLTHDFLLSGEGAASGSASVGNARAEGYITFTNHESRSLIIPTGTIVQTQSGIQFTTVAQADVTPGSDNSVPVPVSAVQAGANGNVDPDTITVIPQSSLQSIARQNGINASDLGSTSLTADNINATSGGGTVSEPAVTAQDLKALTLALHQKLQQEVKTWLTGQTQTGDLTGRLIPDVVNSATPLAQEQLSNVPAVKQAVPSGKFSGTLTVHVQVLIARAASIQAAAGQQLDAAALKMSPARALASQMPITLTQEKGTPSSDGSTLAISASASGAIIARLDSQLISNDLTSKGVSQAEQYLKTGSMAQVGVLDVKIAIFPAFLSILPLRASQIRVVFQPVVSAAPKTLPN